MTKRNYLGAATISLRVRRHSDVHLLFNLCLKKDSAMPNPNITFDHVHLISKDAPAAANWYVDKLGGDIVRNLTVKGAPQVYVEIGGGTMLIVRGERPGETSADKSGL